MTDTNYSDFVDVSVLLVEAHAKIRTLEADIDRLRLTGEEREALDHAAAFIHDKGLHRADPSMVAEAATLRGLLERTK